MHRRSRCNDQQYDGHRLITRLAMDDRLWLARTRKLRINLREPGALQSALQLIRARKHSLRALATTRVASLLAILEDLDPVAAHVLELRYFARLDPLSTAVVLDISPLEVVRKFRFARAWLSARLEGAPEAAR